jgi:hypothetical protein
MSSFLNVSVLVLAVMVLVLAGMVGYLYWQQNKLLRNMSALSAFVQTLSSPLTLDPSPELQPQTEPETEPEDSDEDSDEDDRVSVELVEEAQKVEVPQEEDYENKTAPQLRELLNKKGIPYGKRDSKTVLLELLKASS